MRCVICGADAELCQDGVCRRCHISTSWEDCITHTDKARALMKTGLSREDVLQTYPEAKI